VRASGSATDCGHGRAHRGDSPWARRRRTRAAGARVEAGRRYDELIAAGVIQPAVEEGDPLEGWPDIRLPRGTAAALIDGDRGEA